MDLIKQINHVFLSSNKIIRSKIIESISVLLILNNNQLILMEYGFIINKIDLELTNYNIIKSICHYISIHNLKLVCNQNNNLDDQTIEFIKNNKSIFEFDEIKYWCGLVDMIETKIINSDILNIAIKHTAILFQAELHKNVQGCRKYINNEDEWDNVLVIVTGPPSPRPGHSAMQYFGRLTGKINDLYTPSEEEVIRKKNRKLYYLENVYELDKILDIVGQLLLERKEYDKIIDMKIDILAYDTKDYLLRVCKK